NCSNKDTPDPVPAPVPPVSSSAKIAYWMTKADGSVLLQKQSNELTLSSPVNSYNSIEIDSTQTYQTVDGFGYTLTGGSAFLINQLPAAAKASLLQELFSRDENAIGVSYLRISIGASDLSASVFSYDDMPAGQTDPTLANFSLSQDTIDVIPVLKQILAINPNIKIMGSPWSPPVWMKDNGNSKGGSLLPQYYAVYAQYFVKYIQQMKAKGITIDAITPQNEPLHPGNNPSMYMTALQQADFIKNHLGPAFQAAAITTKIIAYDHNADQPSYPITVLNDAGAKQYIDGSAFHLYAGDISALSTVHDAHPTKNLYFTEQWTGANGTFEGDLKWHTKNVVIGSMRNWSKVALEWNLANDPTYGPHTPGGCTECKGALTINNGLAAKNVAYYIIAHASKFVPAGSVRIASNIPAGLPNVAFRTPEGKKVVIVLNELAVEASFNIKQNGKWALATLPVGTVATYVW
ncbi:MAG: glucosylceramidase, partial [Flavisolibacter sp.]|nr:glucosylceramidase [Flavisolibacter sp.]